MYAIVATGGKQYKVAVDDVIEVEKLEGESGSEVAFDVLFLNDGKKAIFDEKGLASAQVKGEIVEQFKGQKQLIFKFKKRKGYRKMQGHRQNLTKVKITSISA